MERDPRRDLGLDQLARLAVQKAIQAVAMPAVLKAPPLVAQVLIACLSPSSSLPPLGASGNVHSNHSHLELPVAQRRKTRANAGKPPIRYGFEHNIANFISYSNISPAYKAFIASLQTVHVPKDWRAAKQDPKWKGAMKEELSALQKNKT